MAQILIADDDPTQGNVLANLLAQTPGLDMTDVELVRASEGHLALGNLAPTSPSVVIVALTGQGTRALSLCQAIRRSPSAGATKIAVVGGRIPDPEVLRQIEQVFAARFFAQPFELSQLANYVATALGRPNSGPIVKKRPITSFGAGDDGELAERRLPAVLFDIMEGGESGFLHLERGKIQKTISIAEGRPFAIRSNARDETLGQFLLAQKLIDLTAHANAIRRTAASKRRIGAVLVELGAITQTQLAAALTAQVRFKLVRSLRWPDGTWRFEPRLDVFNSSAETLDIEGLVLLALSDTARLSPLPRHLHALKESPLRIAARGRRLAEPLADIYGSEVVAAMFEPAESRVQNLIGAGFPRATIYSLIDTLWHLDALSALAFEQAPDEREVESITVAELSAQSQRRATSNPDGKPLWDLLFADAVEDFAADNRTGARSLSTELPQNLAVPRAVSEFGEQRTINLPTAAPSRLLEIFLRIQGNDHYKVVGADERAEQDQIERAVARTEAELARAGVLDPNAELPLAKAVKESFERARSVLLDETRRAAYDADLRGERRGAEVDPIRAELAFGRAQDAMQHEQWPIAVRELHAAVEAAPEEATYRAALGWCHYLKGNREARAADQARPHLNQALAIDYDHAAAHEYKGLISADLGTDEVEAIFHLRRALDAEPGRTIALEHLEKLYQRRGELRALERQYRRLIQATGGSALEVDLWIRMGKLYRVQLDDPDSAEIAFAAARQLAPADQTIAASIREIEGGGAPSFEEKATKLVSRWLSQPFDPTAGQNLLSHAIQCKAHDEAFVASSVLVALGADDNRAQKLYRRYRPRFVIRAQNRLEGAALAEIRHDSDDPAISELLFLLAPVIHQLSPVTLADLEVGQRELIADIDLPAPFVRVREYVSHMLAVPAPRVYVRSDFEQQVHVGGVNPPVLLVGEDVLVTPERLELAFRLGRAMTYLLPGRTLGGSHSGSLLKRVVLAAFYVTHPDTPRDGAPSGLEPLIHSIEALGHGVLRRIEELVELASSRNENLNLSEWKRSLARTADRVGLVLCGDVPSAIRFTRDTGDAEATTALLRFAIGGEFTLLRKRMGLSIEV